MSSGAGWQVMIIPLIEPKDDETLRAKSCGWNCRGHFEFLFRNKFCLFHCFCWCLHPVLCIEIWESVLHKPNIKQLSSRIYGFPNLPSVVYSLHNQGLEVSGFKVTSQAVTKTIQITVGNNWIQEPSNQNWTTNCLKTGYTHCTVEISQSRCEIQH